MNDRLKKILIAICVIALLLISSLAIYLFMASRNNGNEYDAGLVRPTALPVSQDKPEKTNEFDDIKIDLVDYYTFDLEDVDFNFIIATIRVKSNMSTNIGLEHFKTSENILLSDYASYISILENKGYFLGKQNVFFELVSNELEYYVNIFIPVKDKALNNVSLTIDFGNNKVMNFDMNKKSGNKDMLTYVSDDVISDGKTYQLMRSLVNRCIKMEMSIYCLQRLGYMFLMLKQLVCGKMKSLLRVQLMSVMILQRYLRL